MRNPLQQWPEIQVRLANMDEAASIASLLYQAFVEYEPLYTAEAFAITVTSAEEIERRWSEGPVWSATKDGRLAGTVAAVPKVHSLYIRSMAVKPGARGLGLGRMLLEEVESFARVSGQRRMFLSTTPFLHQAIALYERYGFERTDEGPHDLAGTPLFSMERRVLPPNRPDQNRANQK